MPLVGESWPSVLLQIADVTKRDKFLDKSTFLANALICNDEIHLHIVTRLITVQAS